MTRFRAGFFIVFLAVAAYANSLPNGFAYDDDGIITQNPVVQSGDWRTALSGSWWPDPMDGAGLYRPLTLVSFVGEWKLFGGSPMGFHALNVLFHTLVSLLVFLLLLEFGPVWGALAGGVAFAIHPVHTEAVANVVGRAELHAAFFYLVACLLYWRGRSWLGPIRVLRLLGLGGLYFLALSGKEIAVTLPGALILLEAFAPRLPASRGVDEGPAAPGLLSRLWGEVPIFLLLAFVLASYLGLRYLALGALMGELPAPLFLAIGPGARVLTATALWIQYLRLLLFPLDLAADYDPGVLFPSEGLDTAVIVGTVVLIGWILAALRTRIRFPLVSLGLLWFGVTILPVSNLLFATGVLLAERTLYLPSVGLSMVVAGLAARVVTFAYRPRLAVLTLALVLALAFFIRTVLRNPSWMSSFVVQAVLHEEHPESWRAIRSRARGLERVGETGEAMVAWDLAARLAPTNYTLLVQAGDFHCRLGNWTSCESYLRQAITLGPSYRNAYQLLAGAMISREFGREGHRIALQGLLKTRNDRELWALVSESYILKGDIPAALRARNAAIGADPSDPFQWSRLSEILEAMGEAAEAEEARQRADSLEAVTEPRGWR